MDSIPRTSMEFFGKYVSMEPLPFRNG